MPLLHCFCCFTKKKDEVIFELDFSNNVLTDVFPNVWQHERTLEELYMSSTRIKSLPPELFYCENLRVLFVNNNSLESIPHAIAALRQLQSLNLSRNLISNVPDNMKSCKNLTHLDMSCNNLKRLPDALTSLITLKELFLNETYLEFLPANFGRLINLKVLELRLNNLLTLPKSMARLTNLLRLDLGFNEFTELPEVVGELKQLRELWIDFNQINIISSNVGKLRDLIHFDGAGNNLSVLPNDIGNCRSIEVLSLCTNNLGTFPIGFGSLRSLVTLKCETNDLRQLPDNISSLENLEELELSHNKLTRLPSTIGMLRKLRYLFVDNNDLLSVPNEICSCSELRILSISRNKISELPKTIGRLTQLKVLNIVNNRISSLPLSVLNLLNLTSLWISDNQSQPLVSLQYLDINTKLELTCFMLPQNDSCLHSFHCQRRSSQIFNERDTHDRPAENIDIDSAYQIEPNRTTNSCPKRRICFAENAIVMSDSPNSVLPNNFKTARHTRSNPEMNNVQNINIFHYNTANDNKVDGGIRLMRSPTPYPKELRIMAKYIRNDRRLYGSELFRVKEARLLLNTDVCNSDNITRNMNPDVQNTSTTSIRVDTINITRSQHVIQHQNDYGANNLTQAEIDVNAPLLQRSSHPTSLLNLRSQRNLISNFDDINTNIAVSPPLNPPPYHIARVHTRETTNNLSNYEKIRYQQQLIRGNMNDYETKDIHSEVEVQNKHETNVDHDSIMQDFRYPENNSNNHEYCTTEISDATEYSTHKNKYEFKNHEEFSELPKENKIMLSSLPYSSTDNVAGDYIPSIDNIPAANDRSINHTQTLSSKKTPWFFGVHKNPTVIQVSLKWDNHVGFEIQELPHKEGVFVAATTPNTNAARILCISDKLLEIDGHDLTHLNVLDVKAIILSAGSTIHIMLSRK